MPDLPLQDRLQPALLDRLTDDEPLKTQEPREQRVMSKTRLRQAVLRDLAWLLNANRLERTDEFRGAPLARLADKKRIGTEELRAAEDIAIAFHAQAGALLIKPPSLEKRDATYQAHEPIVVIDAVSRYKRWAHHWSARAHHGDRTLEIVIAAVIDERAFHVIEADVGIRHGLAARAVIAALRDYAARAGWTDRHTVAKWIDAAEAVFPLRRRVV